MNQHKAVDKIIDILEECCHDLPEGVSEAEFIGSVLSNTCISLAMAVGEFSCENKYGKVEVTLYED